jgi:DNA-binding protein H-NS
VNGYQNKLKQNLKQNLQMKASNLGIDLSHYFNDSSLSFKKPATRVKKKYAYKGVKWSGRGRCPKVFQQFFNNGGKKN